MTEPLRSCCACRLKTAKADLIKIVKSPEGNALIDINFKLPGRGTYLCPDIECINKAEKSGCISRSLHGAKISQDFWIDLKEILKIKKVNSGLIKLKNFKKRRAAFE